jgi:hypothetical protein
MHRKHTTAEDGMQTARSVSHSGKTLRWYLSFRPVAVIAAAFAALLTTGLVAGPLASISGAATASATPHALATSGLGYTPLTAPVRIADTRAGATDPTTYAGKTLAEGTSLAVDVPSGDVPATASAVVVNVTAISPSNSGFLTVYPGGSTLPTAANVTFGTNQNVGDQVTVGLGTNSVSGSTQSFSVYNGPATGGGTVDFAADLVGYYAPQTATTGAAYVGLTPQRIFDSRTGSNQTGAGSTLTSGGSVSIPVNGADGVPATATGVVLNVAITNATASSFITAFPAGQAQPGTASQNFLAGETLSSQVVAGIGTGGDVTIANHAGNVDLVVDVDGYFTAPGGSGSLLTVLPNPVRLTDTRPAGVAGGASTPALVQGTNATAGVLSVADVATVGNGNFLTAYPTGIAAPLAATVNYTPGDTYNVVENAAYATTGTGGSVSVLNGPANAASANVVVDEDGYFSSAPSVNTVALVAHPNTVLNNGTSTSTITATVTGPSGLVVGDSVGVTLTGSPAAACGTISPTSGVTSSAGVATFTYTSSTTLGFCTVTAKEAAGSSTGTANVTQATTVPPSSFIAITDTASPSTIPADGVTTSTINATVTGQASAPVVGDEVMFNLVGTACGTFPLGAKTVFAATIAGGTTPAQTYTASLIPGVCTVAVQEANQAQVNTATITQTPVGFAVTLASAPTTVVAGGSNQNTSLTATVTFNGAPVVGDIVKFAVGAGEPALIVCGTVPTTATTIGFATDATGKVSVPYTGGPTVGFCPITATEQTHLTPATTTVTENSGQSTSNLMSVLASPATIPASGTTPTSTITATVTGASHSPILADEVMFTLSGGLSCGTLSAAFGATTAAGTATVTYTSSTVAGTCTVTALEANSDVSSTATVTQSPVVFTVVTAATPTTLTANGLTQSVVTATVTNPAGNPAAGETVAFTVTPTATPPNVCGTLSNASAITNAAGVATVTYTSSPNAPGFCGITGTDTARTAAGSTQVDQTSVN